jgi:hypothetical protein
VTCAQKRDEDKRRGKIPQDYERIMRCMESKKPEDREWARMRIRELAAEKSARDEERGYESESSEPSAVGRYNDFMEQVLYGNGNTAQRS